MKTFVMLALVGSLALLGTVVETEAGGVTVQLHGTSGGTVWGTTGRPQHWQHQGNWQHHPHYVHVPRYAPVYVSPGYAAADSRWYWDGLRWWFWDGYRWIAY